MSAAAITTTETIESGSPMNGTKSPIAIDTSAKAEGANEAAKGRLSVAAVTGLARSGAKVGVPQFCEERALGAVRT